jgi:hypothetical protein
MKETKMPKLKTKSGVKKRFKLTATGKPAFGLCACAFSNNFELETIPRRKSAWIAWEGRQICRPKPLGPRQWFHPVRDCRRPRLNITFYQRLNRMACIDG